MNKIGNRSGIQEQDGGRWAAVSPLRPFAGLILVCSLMVFALSCEEDFDPYQESDAGFAVYGFLDNDFDRQLLRIIPIRPQLERRYTEADFTFEVTMRGPDGETAFRDTLLISDSLNVGLGSTASMVPVPGATYTVRVADRLTGKTAQASTTMPQPVRGEQVLFGPRFLEYFLWKQNIFLEGLLAPHLLEVQYTVENMASGRVDSVRVPYVDVRAGRVTPGQGIAYSILLGADAYVVYDTLRLDIDWDRLRLLDVQLRISSLSEEWAIPEGIRDIETLIIPGVWSNVSHGLGFFGSATRSRHRLLALPDSVVTQMRFYR